MIEALTLRGWSLEYALALTYRQVGCLWERYWKRKTWEIEVSIKTNPMAMGEGDSPSSAPTIDAAYRDWETDRKSTRLNSSHRSLSRMPSSA